MKVTIREIFGDYALDLDFADKTITLYFNSRQNALNVKRIIEVDGSIPNHATVCDMQEVVRCENCKYWGEDERCNGIKNGITIEYTKGYDYCSYGERKDGAEE